ncbi:ribose-5-phosphate isomerase [Candidatus Saccharibacteria bacterium]|nr:ribose-5-phosphate isomerase [Candidatus Saccharibacteria bacterium]
MKVHIATDHAGLEFKDKLKSHLESQGHTVEDHGAYEYDASDDYPGFIIAAAEAVAADWRTGDKSLGVVFGGSGNGEQIAANKVHGIRAALVWNESTAQLARQHNDANVVSIGARQHSESEALHLIDVFLTEPFSAEERHVRRIAQIADYEESR